MPGKNRMGRMGIGRGSGRGRGSGQGTGGAASLWQRVAPLAKDLILRHGAKPAEEKVGLEGEIAVLREEIVILKHRLSEARDQEAAMRSELDSIKKRLGEFEADSGSQ